MIAIIWHMNCSRLDSNIALGRISELLVLNEIADSLFLLIKLPHLLIWLLLLGNLAPVSSQMFSIGQHWHFLLPSLKSFRCITPLHRVVLQGSKAWQGTEEEQWCLVTSCSPLEGCLEVSLWCFEHRCSKFPCQNLLVFTWSSSFGLHHLPLGFICRCTNSECP